MTMSPESLPYLPVRVACLGRYCLVYRPSGVGGSDAAVRCVIEPTRDRATFPTEAATRAWIAVQDPPPRHLPLDQRLRAGRQALPGLSVALLAAAVDVTPATIYQYEADHHRPHRTTLIRLAAMLRLDRAELLTLAGYPRGDADRSGFSRSKEATAITTAPPGAFSLREQRTSRRVCPDRPHRPRQRRRDARRSPLAGTWHRTRPQNRRPRTPTSLEQRLVTQTLRLPPRRGHTSGDVSAHHDRTTQPAGGRTLTTVELLSLDSGSPVAGWVLE
jgi:DNA-binding XRE family transcriptional regulator